MNAAVLQSSFLTSKSSCIAVLSIQLLIIIFAVVDQLALTALDPALIALTKKYFDILVNEEAAKRNEISTGTNSSIKFGNPLDGASSSKRSQLDDNPPADVDAQQAVIEGKDKSASQPSSKNEGFAIPLGNEVGFE